MSRHVTDRPLRTALRARALYRRGFTLLESLMAAGILMIMVVAVTGAITAGQQNAYEAQLRITGALAAEELLGRLVTVDYDDLPTWHNYAEAAGTMTDAGGTPLPDAFVGVGRAVTVAATLEELPGIGVNVGGRTILVRAFDTNDRTLAEIEHFVVEPAENTVVEDEGDDDDDGGLLGGSLGE